jgi:hypothetical protein
MDHKEEFPQIDPELSGGPNSDPDAWLRTLNLGVEGSEREVHLYAQYVRALALLCECAPFVDDEDYADLIDELLADACKHYPLEWRRNGARREIALRLPAPD